MRKYVLLSCGDKLKALRKKYKLKQEDLAGKEITRNLLSEIETGKANLTKNTAEIIFRNLETIAKNKKLEVTETLDYLMEGEDAQAGKILDNYINELRNLSIAKGSSFIDTLNEAESFLMEWDIKEKKIIIYELAGDYFCNNNEVYKSIIYYEKEIDLIGKLFPSRTLVNVLRKLSMVYEYVGNYRESIRCCEFALNRFEDMTDEEVIIFRYNNALSYKKIENFQIALDNLKVAEELVDKEDINSYIKILNNKAVCLFEMKMYMEALKVFMKISELIDKGDIEKYLINLVNIVDVYTENNNRTKAVESLNVIINELSNLSNNSKYISEIHFEIGRAYKRLNKVDLAKGYYLKALDFCEKCKNFVLANDILCDLVDIYEMTKDLSSMNKLKERVFLISNKQDKISNILMYKLINFYNKISNHIVSEITNYALKFN